QCATVENTPSVYGGICRQRAIIYCQIAIVLNPTAIVAAIAKTSIAIGNSERVQHHRVAGRYIENLDGGIAIDLNAAGQRGGVNGEAVVYAQSAGQRDGRAGQVRGKSDGSTRL